ncbi:MAG TPA: 2Fe-2S iron-sulfur cluster-binding protein [Zoogloea sp.]|uniref:2Fe-2S iron-sulfur cluster-binding protein n=1 Tax=Zoogloea sp. TaxID=49181 RepID=UPI002CCAE27B|nr:2Fe-2S iron-sulfur cluster-binding protein [Zoogloea sp.]HMV16285.1 2Fe-2S iron-sulfur cluster-binding protein [Rhodocyclaceae bacterium]HMV63348.1 2Fe-2S iron-sulfur cluster-binding protein [Rhodocyclaceae bacterium]HMW50733.1 2Fe-2S iron-sulfur cluster-binding protein [Rhodocyclaceae bacterium]HMY48638.1 2Fe-2S iron-sulfur cluster-binding protein [Rhodocyclaceae bacterium]HMZ75371.1 2Fe-2S iron-sulfur cluster-binding protein [Rhodocyclaceae bacterium]
MNAPTPTRIVTLRLADHPDEYALLDTEGLTLLNALNHIRPSLPAPLGDAFVCHAGACATCYVLVNGERCLPCTTFVRDLPDEFTVAPGVHSAGWDEQRHDVRRGHGQ